MFEEKINERVRKLYANDKETMEKILARDTNAIKMMTQEYEFTSEMVVYAFEHKKENELYQEAKRQIEIKIKNLYHDICLEYAYYTNRKKR